MASIDKRIPDTHPAEKPPNWLHLDLKGMLPDLPHLLDWIDVFARAGFDGLVWEYEDRIPWQTWPGTFRRGYTIEEWRRIWQRCMQRGLEIVPLIQTLGHLEWLLRHPRYAGLREHGCWNEWCPSHPAVGRLLDAWLEEIVALHPPLRMLHIGCDETWNLARCPRCSARAAAEADGAMGLYTRHLSAVAAKVLARGIRPMVWADMFWRENRMDLAKALPAGTVLVDWHYRGAGPWASTRQLAGSGHDVWGATAVRDSHDLRLALAPLGRGIANLRGWHAQQEPLAGLLHTTWGRSGSLRPVYGPWEGWLPNVAVAGNPRRGLNHPLQAWIPRLDQAMAHPEPDDAQTLETALEALRLEDPRDEACRRWWLLALQHRQLYLQALAATMVHEQLHAVHEHLGMVPDTVQHSRVRLQRARESLECWASEVRAFLEQHGWDGIQEYLDTRIGPLRILLQGKDWAAQAIPPTAPVARR